jgi:hypothetical protein
MESRVLVAFPRCLDMTITNNSKSGSHNMGLCTA